MIRLAPIILIYSAGQRMILWIIQMLTDMHYLPWKASINIQKHVTCIHLIQPITHCSYHTLIHYSINKQKISSDRWTEFNTIFLMIGLWSRVGRNLVVCSFRLPVHRPPTPCGSSSAVLKRLQPTVLRTYEQYRRQESEKAREQAAKAIVNWLACNSTETSRIEPTRTTNNKLHDQGGPTSCAIPASRLEPSPFFATG